MASIHIISSINYNNPGSSYVYWGHFAEGKEDKAINLPEITQLRGKNKAGPGP